MTHRVEIHHLETASPGTFREIKSHHFGIKGARPKIYLQAAIHADELPALLVAHHLLRKLIEADARGEIRGEVVLVPVANPIGLSQTLNGYLVGRYELSGELNFNRNWPDLSPAVAERVAGQLGPDEDANQAIIRAALPSVVDDFNQQGEFASLRRLLLRLAIDADYCFDMHCDNEALTHLYTGVSMISDLSDLSAEIGSSATMIDDDSGGGPFDEAVGGLWLHLRQHVGAEIPIPVGCCSCTIEYRGKADLNDALAESDAAALIRFMQRRGIVAGDPGELPEKLCAPTPLSAVDMVRAPCAGLVSYCVELGQKVSAGDVIAEIVDPAASDPSDARTRVVTEQDGFVLTRLIMKLVRSGDSLAKVVGTTPLASRTGTLLPP